MVETENKAKQIYIFENEIYPILKIGMSDNRLKRMKQVQSNAGFPLRIAYESEPITSPAIVERLIHLELKDYRKGGEWFDLDIKSAKKIINKIIVNSNKGEYKDLLQKYQLEKDCTILLDYNIHNSDTLHKLIEVEPFIYESCSFNYYIVYRQGSLERTAEFCNKGLAIKFKKENFDRLISR